MSNCLPHINIPCCRDSNGITCDDIHFLSSNDSIDIQKINNCTFDFKILNSILETPLSVEQSNSVELIASGTANHHLKANVKISSYIGNNLTLKEDGLYIGGSAIYTDANARASITGITPIIYNPLLGTISIQQVNNLNGGFLSSFDWVTFDNKLSGAANLGTTGETIFSGVVSKVAKFKRLKAGTNVTFSVTADDITINTSSLTEVDTLASVVARGNVVNSPISIQGLTLIGIPLAGSLSDDLLVRSVTGLVKAIPTSSFLTSEADTLDTVTTRGNVTTNDIQVGGLEAVTNVTTAKVDTSSIALGFRTIVADDTVNDSDSVIYVNTAAGNVTLTYDPSILLNKIIVVKKISPDNNTIIINPYLSSIDGESSYTIYTKDKPVILQAGSSGINILAGEGTSSYGSYYVYNNATPTIVPDTITFVKVLGSTTAGLIVKNFTFATANRAVFTGNGTKRFKITVTANLTAGNNEIIYLRTAKNGIVDPESEVSVITSASGIYKNVNLVSYAELVSTDYVEIFVKNSSSTTNVILTDFKLSIESLEQ